MKKKYKLIKFDPSKITKATQFITIAGISVRTLEGIFPGTYCYRVVLTNGDIFTITEEGERFKGTPKHPDNILMKIKKDIPIKITPDYIINDDVIGFIRMNKNGKVRYCGFINLIGHNEEGNSKYNATVFLKKEKRQEVWSLNQYSCKMDVALHMKSVIGDGITFYKFKNTVALLKWSHKQIK